MQPFMKLFLTVLLAHLLGDFPLQSSSMVRGKHQGTRAYVAHGAVHLLVLILCVVAFISISLLTSLWFWIVAALYVSVHLGIDRAKQGLVSKYGKTGGFRFCFSFGSSTARLHHCRAGMVPD
jgi:hypothetical protein